MVATIRCRKYNTIDGGKYWLGREVSNSLRSCGLSETFYVYVNWALANLIDISDLSVSCSNNKDY